MQLLLSSDTMPSGTLDVLMQASRRRALSGLELSLGERHAHGVDEAVCPIRQQHDVSCVPEEASVAWLRMPNSVSQVMMMIWAAAAHQMQAGLLVRKPVPDPPMAVRLALTHGTNVDDVRAAVEWAKQHDVATCWEVEPGEHDLDLVDEVLAVTAPTLAHVRLPGSGPEADDLDHDVTGAVMARLALSGYAGTVSLVPSPSFDLERWENWLLEKRGWGCGTAAQKAAQREARRAETHA